MIDEESGDDRLQLVRQPLPAALRPGDPGRDERLAGSRQERSRRGGRRGSARPTEEGDEQDPEQTTETRLRREPRQGLPAGLRPARASACSHGISFKVREGEIFGFVGPNGAGKTTTLKILMGLIRPQGGSARILGHDVRETRVPPARRLPAREPLLLRLPDRQRDPRVLRARLRRRRGPSDRGRIETLLD